MQKLLYLGLALSLAACGQPDKESTDFSRTTNPSTDPGMSQRQFVEKCAFSHGTLLSGDTVCQNVMPKNYSKEDLDKDISSGFKIYSFGKFPAGSVLWADVSGGQAVTFTVEGQPVASMQDETLSPRAIAAGKLEMRVYKGVYEYLNVYIGTCFTRQNDKAPCPL